MPLHYSLSQSAALRPRFWLWIIASCAMVVNLARAQPVTGDLEINTLVVTPLSITSGGTVDATFNVTNLGPGRGQLATVEVLVDGVRERLASPLTTFVAGETKGFSVSAIQMPTLTPGQTRAVEVRIKISESNATNVGNNQQAKFVTVTAPLPDILPATPSGWSGSIVVSDVQNATSTKLSITQGSTVYANFGWRNAGGAFTTPGIQAQLFLNNSVVFDTPFPPLGANSATQSKTNVSLGTLGIGHYTLELRLDGSGGIQESNENNNSAVLELDVVAPPRPNLAPYAPPGWPSALIVSREAGTLTSSSVFRAGDTAYLDIGYGNFQSTAAGAFTNSIEVNGAPIGSFNDPGLPGLSGRGLTDFVQITGLPAGPSTIAVRLDSTNAIQETNESDNLLQATVLVDGCNAPIQAPVSITVTAGDSAQLTAAIGSGSYGVTFQWQRNGSPLTNGVGGASVGGGTVSGATGALPSPTTGSPFALGIADVKVSDAGDYRIQFTNICGQRFSTAAHLSVRCSTIDLNADGQIDLEDFFGFLNCFDASAACADIDGNPGVDLGDFFTFFNGFDAGC